VILAGRKWQDVLSVGEDDEARLLAGQKFLDHQASAGCAHAAIDQNLVDRSMRLLFGRRDDDPFSRASRLP